MKSALSLIAALCLAGCAALQPAPIETIAQLPVVRVGSQPPQGQDYVLFYPAGIEFPVRLKTRGSLFGSEQQVESRATLSRDLYLYKYWASHDGTSWKNSHALIDVEFGGGFDIDGLQSTVRLDAN